MYRHTAIPWMALCVVLIISMLVAYNRRSQRQQPVDEKMEKVQTVDEKMEKVQTALEQPTQVPTAKEKREEGSRYFLTAAEARKTAGEKPSSFLGSGSIPKWFLELSLKQAQYLFHGTVREISLNCSKNQRYGRAGDGGYNICLDEPYRPTQGDCLVYSFGIANEWSFDEAVKNELACEVHSFDPSMRQKDHLHNGNIYFHNLGVWGSNTKNKQRWEMRDLRTIIKMLNHTKRIIDYVKIDVEGAGWQVLETIVQTGIHSQIKQIAFEIHAPRFRPEQLSLIDYGEIYNALQALRRVGYEKFDYRAVNFCCGRFSTLTPMDVAVSDHPAAKYKRLCCYEVFFVNKHMG